MEKHYDCLGLQEKIWQPLGMEFDAYWAVDNTDFALERAASGIYAAPEEMAKLGRLYLNRGKMGNQQQIIVHTPREEPYGTAIRAGNEGYQNQG